MSYSLLLSGALPFLVGLWMLRINIRRQQLNRYLREHGVCIDAIVTEARLVRDDKWKMDSYITHFNVAYQDEQQRTHAAAFIGKDSDEGHLYLIGAEVAIYYDPSRPERAALAADVNELLNAHLFFLGGTLIFVFGLYHLGKALLQLY